MIADVKDVCRMTSSRGGYLFTEDGWFEFSERLQVGMKLAYHSQLAMKHALCKQEQPTMYIHSQEYSCQASRCTCDIIYNFKVNLTI